MECKEKLRLLTLPRRQSLRSYSNLLKALSLGGDGCVDNDFDTSQQNARFDPAPVSSLETHSPLAPKLQATLLEAVTIAKNLA